MPPPLKFIRAVQMSEHVRNIYFMHVLVNYIIFFFLPRWTSRSTIFTSLLKTFKSVITSHKMWTRMIHTEHVRHKTYRTIACGIINLLLPSSYLSSYFSRLPIALTFSVPPLLWLGSEFRSHHFALYSTQTTDSFPFFYLQEYITAHPSII